MGDHLDTSTAPEFTSLEAECSYWKGRAKELKLELDEFTEDSHQLEKELEITIKLKEDQLTDLRHKYNRQQHDNDNLVAKLKQYENELLQWEQRFKKEKVDADHLRKHTRELEQKNDDLERAHRIVTESVAEFERMLNREYEKNVMLEVEYEMEKENAQIQLQRLMDEARDLKQELKVQQKQPGVQQQHKAYLEEKPDRDSSAEDVNKQNHEHSELLSSSTGHEKMELEKGSALPPTAGAVANGTTISTTTGTGRPMTRTASVQRENSIKQMERLKNGSSMTASSRSTALAIVADLLRRVNNIDATLKELKRPKSMDDDLGESPTNDPIRRPEDSGGTMHGQPEATGKATKAKSPTLIC